MNRNRKNTGSLLVDAPLTLFIIFIVIFFPLLDFATITLRATFVIDAAHNAAHAAARASTFTLANSTAQNQVTTSLNGCTGVQVSSVSTDVVVTPIASDTPSRPSTPLTAVNTTTNTYNIEVTLKATINPLITYNGGFLGSIPGFTGPILLTIPAQEYFENPQGLTQ